MNAYHRPHRSGRRSRRGAIAASIAAAVMVLPACAADDVASSPPDVSAYLPAQNLDLWTMPLDQYMVSGVQTQKETYAIVLLTQQCLDEQGFVHQVPARTFVEEPFDTSIRDFFTPEIVARSGYHSPGTVRERNSDWDKYNWRSRSEAEVEAEGACVDQLLDDGFVRYENHVLNFASGLAQAAFAGSLEAPEVKSTAEAWRECMAPRGIEDMPAAPSGMPSESLSDRFELWATPDAGQDVVVTQEEIELAVFDAQCRQSSGYEQARYDVEWSRQVTLLAENLTALEDVKSQIEEVDRSISDVIASHAPEA